MGRDIIFYLRQIQMAHWKPIADYYDGLIERYARKRDMVGMTELEPKYFGALDHWEQYVRKRDLENDLQKMRDKVFGHKTDYNDGYEELMKWMGK